MFLDFFIKKKTSRQFENEIHPNENETKHEKFCKQLSLDSNDSFEGLPPVTSNKNSPTQMNGGNLVFL